LRESQRENQIVKHAEEGVGRKGQSRREKWTKNKLVGQEKGEAPAKTLLP